VSGKDVGGALPVEEVVGLGEVTGLGAVLLGGGDWRGGGALDAACVGAS
jgi:hypothetical protein